MKRIINIILLTAIEKVDKRATIFTKLSQIWSYADDVTILAKTDKELKRIYQKLEEAVNELGSYTNETKTKYMSITNEQGTVHNNSIEIGSKRFEKVEKFKFWGMIINSKNNMTQNSTGQNSSRKQSLLF
jgi:hypothetical protein